MRPYTYRCVELHACTLHSYFALCERQHRDLLVDAHRTATEKRLAKGCLCGGNHRGDTYMFYCNRLDLYGLTKHCGYVLLRWPIPIPQLSDAVAERACMRSRHLVLCDDLLHFSGIHPAQQDKPIVSTL